MDKPEIAVEPLAEPPAQPPDAPCPYPPKSEHRYHHAAGHAYEAGYGAAHCLKLLANQYVSYNSSLAQGSSGSFRDYTNMPLADPMLSEEVL